MAGIYERVKPAADDRVSIELIFQALLLRGIGEYTSQEAADAVNETVNLPLAGAEITDIQNLLGQMLAQADNTARLVYLNKAKAVFHQWEQGISIMPESRGRTILGI